MSPQETAWGDFGGKKTLTVKNCGRAASLWYHARGIMYRLVFQNCAARKGPLVVERPSLVIGRHADCHIQIAEPGVCDRHATIERQADGYYVREFDSSSRIRVNGVAMTWGSGAKRCAAYPAGLPITINGKPYTIASGDFYNITVTEDIGADGTRGSGQPVELEMVPWP